MRQDAEQGMLFRDEYASRLEDKINPYFGTRYWLGAALLPTFPAVGKSMVDVSRKAVLKEKTDLNWFY